MQVCRWPLMAVLVAVVFVPGCRQAEPPKFTPSAAVLELVEGLDPEEDAEDFELLSALQDQVTALVAERTGTPAKAKMLGNPHVDEDHLKRGAELYAQYCVQCHGVNGDGNGPVADYLYPRPRNYTTGVFKFVATENGSKARRADLVRTLRHGVTGTSMPSFDEFADSDLKAVADYVLSLTLRGLLENELAAIAYDDEELPPEEELDEFVDEVIDELLEPWRAAQHEVVMPLTPMPRMSEETVARGKELFVEYSCHKCHGEDGRGSMFGDVDVGEDAWGYESSAADLTSGMFRGGERPIDLYRRVLVGINGAPMPSRRADLAEDPEAIWHIVHFIKDLGEQRRDDTVEATLVGLNRMTAPAASPGDEESTDAADEATSDDADETDADPPAEPVEETPADADNEEPVEEAAPAEEAEPVDAAADEPAETEPTDADQPMAESEEDSSPETDASAEGDETPAAEESADEAAAEGEPAEDLAEAAEAA